MYKSINKKSITSRIAVLSLLLTILLSVPATADGVMAGDVNGDGQITASDALQVLQAVTGKLTLTNDERICADVDGQVGVSSSDALAILQYATDKINWFPYQMQQENALFSWIITDDTAFDTGTVHYDGKVAITGYKGSDSTVVFPAEVEDSAGKSYQVIRLTNNGKTLAGMENVTQIVLPEGLESIGAYAFANCNLTGSLTIPNSVQTIENHAFYCSGGMEGDPGFTGTLRLGNNVKTIGDYAFFGCFFHKGSLIIPDSVQTIGDYAFQYCAGFPEGLVLGDNVQTIGRYAFNADYGFTGTLTIPDSVQVIGESAFSECAGFTGTVTVPQSVTTIDPFIFNLTGFNTARIPEKFMSLSFQFAGAIEFY